MNLFELFVKISVDDQASKNISGITSKLGNGLKTAAKIGTAAVSAAAAGITALTTAAIKNYAEYEQLVGGVDTLFKDASKKVQQYAADAYKTAGLSANDYMSTVTSFSASLLQSLGGDTKKAAEYADMAVKDMSDNANKMGTDMSLIQTAYQGFAKQNYAMLDNLKLGYGGTSAEMYRLLQDATKLNKEFAKTAVFSLDEKGHLTAGFSDITKAINIVQREMGIYGTTALEAEKTISGSLASMKAAWSNLITGVADDAADFDILINNMVESVGTFGKNILPRVETALDGVLKLVEGLFPKIVEKLPDLLEGILPNLVSSALAIVEKLISSIADNGDTLSDSLMNAISSIILHAAKNTPKLIGSVIDLVLSLITELGKNLGTIIPELIVSIMDVIYELATRAPDLTDAIFAIVDGIINVLTSPESVVKMTVAGVKLLIGLISGIVGSIPKLIGRILLIIPNIIDSFLDADWKGVGKNIVDGIWGGLKNAWKNLKKWFTDAWENLVGGVKDLLGIHSPSRVFAGIGKNMALGVGEGWNDTFGDIEDDIDSSLDFGESDYGITTSATSIGDFGGGSARYGYGSSQNVNVTVGIDNNANAMGLARALLPFLKISEKEVYA